MADRIRGEVKSSVLAYLRERDGEPVTIAEIRMSIQARWPAPIPQSSVRSALQDTHYFERVSRGVFRLRPRP